MYGAILGDIIGSPYEFDWNNCKSKKFPLFCKDSRFTDDSVMTAAVADALLSAGPGANDEAIRAAVTESMQRIGRHYPDCGYGGRFHGWIFSPNPAPYGSFGNGSAMRVSSVGWLYDSPEQVRHIARLTAEVTHDHAEGIKGAEAVASAVFLARTGSSKAEIRSYTEREFSYDLSRSCDEIRPDYRMDETCQGSVPEAMTAFLESADFEDAIRTAVSLGGDSDTIAAIAGSMAEAFYGLAPGWKKRAESFLTPELLDILHRFHAAVSRRSAGNPAECN